MLWVWVIPSLILCCAIVKFPDLKPEDTYTSVLEQQSRLSHYFGRGCRPEDHCIDQLVITMPFLCVLCLFNGSATGTKDAPEKVTRRSRRLSLKPAWRSGLRRFFDCSDCKFVGYAGILLEKLVECGATFQIGQHLEPNPSSAKDGFLIKNVWVSDDGRLHILTVCPVQRPVLF